MSTRYLYPEGLHTCNAQNALGGAATVPVDTLAQCSGCGQWWYTRVVEIAYRSGPVWLPVLWYHWRLRRRIRRAL